MAVLQSIPSVLRSSTVSMARGASRSMCKSTAAISTETTTASNRRVCHTPARDAKANKDYAAADAIRDELIAMGIAIKDGPEGTTWSRIVE